MKGSFIIGFTLKRAEEVLIWRFGELELLDVNWNWNRLFKKYCFPKFCHFLLAHLRTF